MALYFDMTKFTEGEHIMAFRLFFENTNDEKRLLAFKNPGNWDVVGERIALADYPVAVMPGA